LPNTKLPSIQVYEVASFYSMFETHPCGRHHVSVHEHLVHRSTARMTSSPTSRKTRHPHRREHARRRIFLKCGRVPGACTGAPMMISRSHFYEHLTPASVDAVLGKLK
jgi:NADH-quinone oxidoreductase subunit E